MVMVYNFTILFPNVFPIYFVLIHYDRMEENPACLFPRQRAVSDALSVPHKNVNFILGFQN